MFETKENFLNTDTYATISSDNPYGINPEKLDSFDKSKTVSGLPIDSLDSEEIKNRKIQKINKSNFSDELLFSDKKSEHRYWRNLLKQGDLTGLDNKNRPLTGIEESQADGMYAPGAIITEPDDFVNSGTKWSQPGGRGTPVTITYSYSNLLNGAIGIAASTVKSAIQEALGLWAKYAPLNFVEVVDSGPAPSDSSYSASGSPQIRFGYHSMNGSGGVLAHAYYPSSTTDGLAGDVHFDIGDAWTIGNAGSAIDLLEVAVHEIGHALGLGHQPTSGNIAIMRPYYGDRYSGLGGSFLFQDDINGIRDIYGTGIGSVTPLPSNFTGSLLTDYVNMKGDFTNLIVGDYNGDGKDDFIRQEKGSWANNDDINTAQLYLSNGNGTFNSRLLTDYTSMKGDFTNLIVGDYNGDGKDDFIRQEKGSWANNDDYNTAQLYLSNGNGTFNSRLLTDYTSMKGDFTNLIVGDYNGDGKDDFIRQEKGSWANNDDYNTAQLYLSNGNGTFNSRLLTDYVNMKGDFTNLIVGDYNGDGKDDFIRQEKSSWDNDEINTANVYLSNGNGTFSGSLLTDWQHMKGDFTNLIVGDYNGDGKDDFIRQEKSSWANDEINTANVYLSNGNGTFSGSLLTDWQHMKGDFTNLIVGDYNGDGKDDFIRQEKGFWANDEINTANVYLSNGNGTFSGSLLTDYVNMKGDFTNLIVGDYNGDGKNDFIRQEKSSWDNDDILTAQLYRSNV